MDSVEQVMKGLTSDCPRALSPFRYCSDCDGSFPCQMPGAQPVADNAKIDALAEYERVREQGKNPDGSPYKVSHEESMAFLNGWDALIKHIRSRGGENHADA